MNHARGHGCLPRQGLASGHHIWVLGWRVRAASGPAGRHPCRDRSWAESLAIGCQGWVCKNAWDESSFGHKMGYVLYDVPLIIHPRPAMHVHQLPLNICTLRRVMPIWSKSWWLPGRIPTTETPAMGRPCTVQLIMTMKRSWTFCCAAGQM